MVKPWPRPCPALAGRVTPADQWLLLRNRAVTNIQHKRLRSPLTGEQPPLGVEATMATDKMPGRNQRPATEQPSGSRLTNIPREHSKPSPGPELVTGNTSLTEDDSSGAESEHHGFPSASPTATTDDPPVSEEPVGLSSRDQDLVSVLYHALQGAETCSRYGHDAEQHEDAELVQFFREVREKDMACAQKALKMLVKRGVNPQVGSNRGPMHPCNPEVLSRH